MNDISERKRKWLEEHDRLSRLFKEDRLTFERERKKRINNTIDRSRSRAGRVRLRELQNQWDSVLRGSGSEHNRFVMIQMLFWDQIQEVWSPTLNCYENKMNREFVTS